MVTNSFGNRNFMQPMGRLSMHSKCLDFFSFKFWVGWGREDFFSFFLCPQIFALAISPGQKWWPTVLEIEISCCEWERSACTHERSSFFLFERANSDFFLFFPCSQCVSIKLSSSPHQVPKRFSNSQSVPRWVPQDVPNSTWVLSYVVCPKFNSPVYKLKRWMPGVRLFCN